MTRKSLALFLSLIVCCGVACASPTPASVQLTVAQKSATVGSKVKGTIKITFAEGRHAYQNPPSKDYMIPVAVTAKSKGYKLETVTYPKGVLRKTVGESDDVAVYVGTISIPVVLDMPAKPGVITIKLDVSCQQCTESDCYQPEDTIVVAKITVKAAAPK
jgi:DsbC/DsbD-like thiol-disulfide interchange protein